ncbi:MAG: DNA repair protein RadC [Bacilli bacterium]
MKIKEIPINDRPRERLINKGVNVLSNEELLAIIIKTGTKDLSVKELANEILKKLKDFRDLKDLNIETFLSVKGIGKAKACELMAAIELGKRLNLKLENIKEIKISNAHSIYDYYKNILSDKKQECFYCVYLDTKSHIIKDKLLFVGSINESLVRPREIFKEAYLLNASSIICVHNHPSGSCNPSDNDINITKQLASVGSLMGVKILDHIIIGDDYFSFVEHGLL